MVLPAGVTRAETTQSLRLEAGAEYDSNIHRFEVGEEMGVPIEAAPLGRIGARYRLQGRLGGANSVRLHAFAGAKFYGTESGQSENVTIAQADLGYSHTLRSRSAVLGAQGSFYDASHVNPFDAAPTVVPRTFSTAGVEGLVTLFGPGRHRLTASAGLRTFTYDPRPEFDWSGEHYGLVYRTTLWRGDPDSDLDASSIELTAGYRLERRGYRGSAFTKTCPDQEDPELQHCLPGPTALGRSDLLHAAHAEALYAGERIYSARYEIQANDSNSYGQSLVRQRLELKVTTELFSSGVYLTATGTVLLNLFLDPLLLAPDVASQTFISIEDENRNALAVHLARDLAERLSVEARYAIYSSEFATRERRFRRQIAYLGLVYDFEP